MGLETKVQDTIQGTRDYLSGATPSIQEYMKSKRLARHLEGVSPEERKNRESALESYVSQAVAKYDKELNGMLRKTTTRGSMSLAFLNDIYSLVSNTPFKYTSAVSYALFGVKTLAEVPALYRYMKKSKDWYGALQWAAMKPINYLLPFIGPALEAGSFERIVKRRVIYEAEKNFLKAFQNGIGQNTLKDSMKMKLGDVTDFRVVSPEEMGFDKAA